MESFLREIGIADRADLPSRLWNCDETGFCTAVASQVVLAQRGSKAVRRRPPASHYSHLRPAHAHHDTCTHADMQTHHAGVWIHKLTLGLARHQVYHRSSVASAASAMGR